MKGSMIYGGVVCVLLGACAAVGRDHEEPASDVPAGWIDDMNEYINDPEKTNPDYNWEDMLEGVRNSCATLPIKTTRRASISSSAFAI